MTGLSAWLFSRKYIDDSLIGIGALKGSPCMVKSIVKENGRNTITFLWEDTEGGEHESTLTVLDGTPIYEWQSGDSYQYSDLVIYASSFYRCITANSDVEFDATKWNEIGSPDGNYDIVENSTLLPTIFTAADRKLYYSIDDGFFWLWDGYDWVEQISFEATENSTLPVTSGALFAVKEALESGQHVLTSAVNTNKTNIGTLSNLTTEEKTSLVGAINELDENKQDNLTFDNTPTAGSNNPVKSSGIKTAIENSASAMETLIRDTTGWTGKNLIPKSLKTTVTNNGITFVFNADGSVTFSGTSGNSPAEVVFDSPDTQLNEMLKVSEVGTDLIINGSNSANEDYCVESIYRNSANAYISDQRAWNGDLRMVVPANAYYIRTGVLVKANKTISTPITVYPMIRKASITDPTYEPYHESVETMFEEEIHGVNLLKVTATSQTVNGVTFTVNADGSVTANGTATANAWLRFTDAMVLPNGRYIISGVPSNGNYDTTFGMGIFDTDGFVLVRINGSNESEFISTGQSIYCQVVVRNGQTVNNITFKPMLRKAEIEDSTYRPYNEQAIQNQLNAQTGVLGAKNLLQNTGVAQTVSGVTFTKNADGSVTANGTATAAIPFKLSGNILDRLDPTQEYILSGCPKGGSATTYRIYVSYSPDNGNLGNDYGDGVRFSLSSTSVTYTAINIYIYISSGAVLNNLTFYPMIRLASDPDSTYVPYAMTNRELTENVASKALSLILSTENATLLRNDSKIKGDIVNVRIQLQVTAEIAKDAGIIRISNISHVGYGIAVLGESNTGNIIEVLAVHSSSDVVFTVKSNVPIGYYALNYTYIQ